MYECVKWKYFQKNQIKQLVLLIAFSLYCHKILWKSYDSYTLMAALF